MKGYIPSFTFQEEKPTFLLDFLFESLHEGGKYLEQDIRDEINTIAIGGSNTSVITISFVLLMLATFPDIQLRTYYMYLVIYMKLLERVIKETLVLYAVVAIIARKVTQDVEGQKAGVHKKVLFNYNLHRNEKHWAQPLVFDPDRFLPGRHSSSNFFPFSCGCRNCIGQKLAMLETTIITTIIIHCYVNI
ncbi:hypothetical protein HZH68_015005 [Vespula germanica]|uniref:Cytochrome P450 n=1 Tax=Vespula germanica TaxID=30212 RepID=A0A834J8S2_VESGE|nr:hypothetical protein HZH68_015005 [Vespula germanica]